MKNSKRNALILAASVAGSSAVFPWLVTALHNHLSDIITVLFPGPIFAVALWLLFPRRLSRSGLAVAVVIVTTGWYGAYRIGGDVYDAISPTLLGLAVAGALAGAIGGLAVGLAALSQPANRGPRPFLAVVLAGALLGTLALPAGFLFQAPTEHGFNFIFLTFAIWQPGVGWAVLAAGRLSGRTTSAD